MLTILAADVRFALRMLRKSPAFSIIAVLVMSLGIGAVTTVYSALHALVLRPLPGTRDGVRVVGLRMHRSEGSPQMTTTRTLHDKIAARARTLDGAAGWSWRLMTASTGSEGIAVRGAMVTGNYFSVLGVRPAAGRFFLAAEDSVPGAHPVVVLSHAFWTQHLGSDRSAMGRVVSLNGVPLTVIGVAPPEFLGAMPIVPSDVFIPFALQSTVIDQGRSDLAPRTSWVRSFARLKDGVTLEAAERELSALVAERAADPREIESDRQWARVELAVLRAVPEDARGGFLGFITFLLGAAGLVLLIASVNVASMLSARAVARRREMALRTALGATRRRLVRQLLTESLLLFGIGAAGGVVVAVVTTNLLEQMRLPFDRAPVLEVSPDLNALLFALGLSLVTGVLFGLSPALQASKKDVVMRLRDDSAGAGRRRSRALDVLVAAQLSASLVLLVSSGLFIRALERGSRVDPGFDATGVTSASLTPDAWGYDDAKARAFLRTLREYVEGLPGVAAVTYAGFVPMSMSGSGGWIGVGGREGRTEGERRGPNVRLMHVAADYFSVMRVPLLSGRPVVPTDDARAPLVAVVNETLARRFWPDRSALGETFTYGDRTFTVVGVARDAKYDRLDEAVPPVVYFSMDQEWLSSQVMLVRTIGNPEAMTRALQEAVLAIDPRLPRPTVATVERSNRVVLLPQRIAAAGTSLLGGLGLLMATVGLYGIVSYSVGRRTREIGVRIALGARRADVLALVLRDGLRLTSIGVVIGLVAAVAATRLLSQFLLDVNPLDVVSFGGMSVLFVAVAGVASYLPARRAASANPVSALRGE